MERHPEHAQRHEHAAAELEAARAERLAQLESSPEANHDRPEDRAEAAREAIARHEQPTPEPAAHHETSHHATRHHVLDIKLNYAQTVTGMQRHLTTASRNFSKFIHNPAVEKTSDALESTVARPSVMLGATWTALIVGTVFYLTARHFGYHLSGSELLLAFVVGALLGIAGEGLWRALGRRR